MELKKTAVKLFDHTHITYLLSTSLAWCNVKMDSGVFFHTYVHGRWKDFFQGGTKSGEI